MRGPLAFVVVGLLAACSTGDDGTRLTGDEAAAEALASAAPGARVTGLRVVEGSEGVRVDGRRLPTSVRDKYPGPVWIVEVEIGGTTTWVIVDDKTGKNVLVISPQTRTIETKDQG